MGLFWYGFNSIHYNVKKQYIITFFSSLIPAYVIERLFWAQRGMGVQTVVYTEIIYALTVTLLEVPSGILADKFGRKRMLLADKILSAVEFLLILTAHDFWQFGFAVFLTGIGKAFSSGSQNALLYDSLLKEGKQGDFEKHLGRLSGIEFTSYVAAGLSGGVLADLINFEFTYIISIISACIAFIITLTLKEPPIITKRENDSKGFKEYAEQAAKVFASKPLIVIYCLTGAFLGSCMIYLDEFWQIVLADVGVPVIFFGMFGAYSAMLRIPGNLFAYKLKEKFKYKHIFAFVICVNIFGYAAVFLTGDLLCLLPMTALFITGGIVDPLVMGYLHHHTESGIRATVESFSSLALRILSAAVGLGFGYFSSEYSIFAGFLMLGAVCFGYLILFGFAGEKYFNKGKQ